MDPIAAIGVDLGGSWLRVQALSERREPVFSLKFPAVAVHDLPRALKKSGGGAD